MSGDQRSDRRGRTARSAAPRAPPRVDRLLLPDARLVLRRGGCGAGDAGPRLAGAVGLRGPLRAAILAVPDRHQRLPRPALGSQAPGPADGPLGGPVAGGRDLARRAPPPPPT